MNCTVIQCFAIPAFLLILLLPRAAVAQTDSPEFREGAGVDPKLEALYEKGIKYLIREQEAGTWGKESGSHACGTASLCVMAFMSTGEDPNYGKYADNIRRGLRFIILNQDSKTGYIPNNMYNHGFAMLALTEAYGAVDDELLWEDAPDAPNKRTVGQALELAVRLTLTAQKKNSEDGWRYGPDSTDADTSVAGTVLMGLFGARNAGIAVPDESIDRALEYFKRCTDKDGYVIYGAEGLGFPGARIAIANLVFAIGKRKHWSQWKATTDYLVKDLLEGNDKSSGYTMYIRYYEAQALFQSDFEAWKKWNRKLIDQLSKYQSPDGGLTLERNKRSNVLKTSMLLLTAALNYRFLPIYER